VDTIGKIFAFIVLVCAVAFVSAAYVLTQETTNWKTEANKWKTEKEKVEKELGDQITELNGQVDQAQKAQAAAEKKRDDETARVNDREGKLAEKKLEIDALTKANVDLRGNLDKAQETIASLTTDKNALQTEKDEAVTAKTTAVEAQRVAENNLAACQDDLKKTQGILAEKMAELAQPNKELELVPVVFGPDWRDRIAGVKELPPVIKGVVRKADNNSGLVMLSVGSDDGVKKGMTFEVVRLPQKYIGRVEVYELDDEVSYCRIMPAMTEDPIEEGDYVATRLQ
jgi:hypothetical protein